MSIIKIIESLLAAYLLGSLPSAVWIGKAFHKTDVREHGSGNAGATNVIRVLGWLTGIPVLLIDLAKGWVAAMMPVFLKVAEPESPELVNMQIASGIVAILGHVYPVFASFRGGKGVATIFGVLLALHPLLTLSCIGVFLAMLLATRIVSVSSMTAGVAFPLLLFTAFDTPSVVFRIFSVVVAIGLFYTHRQNIKRLIKGEEKKLFTYGNKSK